MEPRISIITLGVNSLKESCEFYKNGLGFPTTWDIEKGIVFFQTQGTCLALYENSKLAEDVGVAVPETLGFSGVTLAHNVREKAEVDKVIACAENAGAKIVKPAKDAFWGGYSGYFSDPDGHLWEVAYGAFEFNKDGSLIIT